MVKVKAKGLYSQSEEDEQKFERKILILAT